MSAPFQEWEKQLWQGIRRNDPQAINTGLQRGLLRFSPQQQGEITRLQHERQKIESDQSLTPGERSHARAMNMEQMHSIMPMEVPPDQRPPDPASVVQSKLFTMPDPITGKPARYYFDRSGVIKEFMSKREQAQIDVEKEVEKERRLAAEGLGPKATSDSKIKEHEGTVLEKHQDAWDKRYDNELEKLRLTVDEDKLSPQESDELRR